MLIHEIFAARFADVDWGRDIVLVSCERNPQGMGGKVLSRRAVRLCGLLAGNACCGEVGEKCFVPLPHIDGRTLSRAVEWLNHHAAPG
eukprot:gene11465-2362_t